MLNEEHLILIVHETMIKHQVVITSELNIVRTMKLNSEVW